MSSTLDLAKARGGRHRGDTEHGARLGWARRARSGGSGRRRQRTSARSRRQRRDRGRWRPDSAGRGRLRRPRRCAGRRPLA